MRRLALILLSGFSFAAAHAQVAFGVKGGLNISNVNGSDASGTSSLVGFNAGAYLTIPVAPQFSFQPEVFYSAEGFKQSIGGYASTQRQTYLDVPILVKYSFSGAFLESGPQAGFLMNAKLTSSGISDNNKGDLHPAEFSWVLGAGIKIPMTPISVDARYDFGLSNVYNTDQTANNGSIHNGSFEIDVMILLFSRFDR